MRRAHVIAIALCGASTAVAEPRIAIRASGDCPSAQAIERALPARVQVVPEGDGELIVVEQIDGGAIVHVVTADGPIDARLASRDCAVLAAAVAAVADARFVELPAPAPAPALVAPAATPPTAPVREQPEPPAAVVTSPRWNLGAARALSIDPARSGTSSATQIDVGWWTPWRDMRLRARFDWGSRRTLANAADGSLGADRQAWALSLALARRFGHGRLWLEGAAGGALVVSHVTGGAMQLGGEVVRAHPAGAAIASTGVRIGAGASLRLELGGLVYPLRDRYTSEMTTVARSPRSELAAGVGLEVAFGERIW